MGLLENGYILIELNSGFEDLIAKTFEKTIRNRNIQPISNPATGVFPYSLGIWMEHLTSVVHRDYTTHLVEKKIGLDLIPTYCYTRKYPKGSTLAPHTDRDACEISLTYCISGPEWEIEMGNDVCKTKKGNGVIYMGCEILHGRSKPSPGEIIQVFNHWIISGGTKADSAYDDGHTKDFYIQK